MLKIFYLVLLTFFLVLMFRHVEVFADQNSIEQSAKANVKEAKKVYSEAVSLFKARRFVESKEKFLAVEALWPGFKATRKFLIRIDKEIQREKDLALEQKQLDFFKQIRQEKINERNQKKPDTPLSNKVEASIPLPQPKTEVTHKVEGPLPSSGSVEASKTEIIMDQSRRQAMEKQVRSRQEELKVQRAEINKEIEGRLRVLYDQAVSLYLAGEYPRAKAMFSEVNSFQPGYQKTQKFLSLIETDIKKQKKSSSENKRDKNLAPKSPPQKEIKKEKPAANKQHLHEEKAEKSVKTREKARKKSLVSARVKAIQNELKSAEKGHRAAPKTSELSQKNNLKQKRLDRKAEAVYSVAMSLYLAKDYPGAKKRFLQVEKIEPDYKTTREYLQRIDRLLGENSIPLIKINGVKVKEE